MLSFFYLIMLIIKIDCELENWNNTDMVDGGKQLVSEVSPAEKSVNKKHTKLVQVNRKTKKIRIETVPHICLDEDAEFPLEKSAEILLDNRDADICGQIKGIKRSLPEIIDVENVAFNEGNTYKTITNNENSFSTDGPYKQNTDKIVDQIPGNSKYWKRSNSSIKVKFKKLKNKTLDKINILMKGQSSHGSKDSKYRVSKDLHKKEDSFFVTKHYLSSFLDAKNFLNNTRSNSFKSANVMKHRESAKREVNDLYNDYRHSDSSTSLTSNESAGSSMPSYEDGMNYREKSLVEINKLFFDNNAGTLPNKTFSEISNTSTESTPVDGSENNVDSSNLNTSSIPSEIHNFKREFVGVGNAALENNHNCSEVNKNHAMLQNIMGESTKSDRDTALNSLRKYGVTEKLVKKGTTEDVCVNIVQTLTEKKIPIEETANDEGVYTSSKYILASSTIFSQLTDGTYTGNSVPVTSVFWSRFFDSNTKATYNNIFDNFPSSTYQNDNPTTASNTETHIVYLTDTKQTDSYFTESKRIKKTIIPTSNSNINPTQYDQMKDIIQSSVGPTKQLETSESSIIKSLDFSETVSEHKLPNSENFNYCLSLFQKMNLISATSPSFDGAQIKAPSYSKIKEDFKMANLYPTSIDLTASYKLPRAERPKYTFFSDEQKSTVTFDSIYYDFYKNKTNNGPHHTLSFVSGASSSKISNKTLDTFIIKLANQSNVFQKAKANTNSQLLMLNHDEFKSTGSTLPLYKRIFGLTSKKPTKLLPSATLSVEECITLQVHPVRHKGGDPGNHYHHGQLEPTVCENSKKHSASTCLQLTPTNSLAPSKHQKTLTTCHQHSKICDECEVNDLKDILPQTIVSTHKFVNQE